MSIFNPSIFAGEQSSGTTAGAPLSTDVNNQLISGISTAEVSATASASSSTTDQVMTGMTTTPVAGTYLVWWSGVINSAISGTLVTVSIRVGGTQKTDSVRIIMPFAGGTLTAGNQEQCCTTNGLVTVNGSQAIEIWWKTSGSAPTVLARTMTILRVA